MPMRIAAISLLLFATGCHAQETFTWNQRMTVTVETPDGPVSGSTIYEVAGAIFPQGGGADRGGIAVEPSI